jgi:Cys-tRNA(Pro) deacylase
MADPKDKSPMTPAIRMLKANKVEYVEHHYDYIERGGTGSITNALGFDEHMVIKTLIFETDAKKPFVVLMHGDCSVSTKNMARHLGVKSVAPCDPSVAEHFSGYHCGGTSPFGTRRKMPIYVEKTILDLPRIVINGGHRGFVVEIDTKDLVRVLDPIPVEVANKD